MMRSGFPRGELRPATATRDDGLGERARQQVRKEPSPDGDQANARSFARNTVAVEGEHVVAISRTKRGRIQTEQPLVQTRAGSPARLPSHTGDGEMMRRS